MISMASRDAFGDFTFAAFSAKNIPVVVAVFIPIKTTHFIVYISNGYDVVLVVDPVFHWLVFYLQPQKFYMQKIRKRQW